MIDTTFTVQQIHNTVCSVDENHFPLKFATLQYGKTRDGYRHICNISGTLADNKIVDFQM